MTQRTDAPTDERCGACGHQIAPSSVMLKMKRETIALREALTAIVSALSEQN